MVDIDGVPAASVGRLGAIRADVRGWTDWLATPRSPVPTSSIYGDDKLHPVMPVSSIVALCLLSSADHLDAMVEGLFNYGRRPIAYYTMGRAALLASSRVVWMLSPRLRRTRQFRSLEVAFVDFSEMRKASSQVAGSVFAESYTEQELKGIVAKSQSRVDEVATLVKETFDVTLGYGKGLTRPTSDTDVITAAAKHLASGTSKATADALVHSWRTCSGYAHGLSWPTLDSPVVEDRDGQKYRHLAGDGEEIAAVASGASLVTQEAMRLYKSRIIPL